MHDNRYYIIAADDPNINDILAVAVGLNETQRFSLDGMEIVIKLHKNDHKEYEFLKEYKKYNHKNILKVMQTDKWTQNIKQDA